MSTAQKYNNLSRLLHWLTAFLMAAMFLTVWIAEEVPEDIEHLLVNMHKSFGVLVFVIVSFRIVWRLLSPKVEPVKAARLLQIASHAVHGFLYLLMLAMPLIGWAFVSAKGRDINFFNLVHIPPFMDKAPELAHDIFEAHELGADLILVLLAAHVGAAVYHRFFLKDGVMDRMLP